MNCQLYEDKIIYKPRQIAVNSYHSLITINMYECIQCNRPVRPQQEGIQCDGCQQWQHRDCNTGHYLILELMCRWLDGLNKSHSNSKYKTSDNCHTIGRRISYINWYPYCHTIIDLFVSFLSRRLPWGVPCRSQSWRRHLLAVYRLLGPQTRACPCGRPTWRTGMTSPGCRGTAPGWSLLVLDGSGTRTPLENARHRCSWMLAASLSAGEWMDFVNYFVDFLFRFLYMYIYCNKLMVINLWSYSKHAGLLQNNTQNNKTLNWTITNWT